MLSAEQRSIRARLAAHEMHAQHDPRQTSAAGRAAILRGFEDQVDPNRELPEAERKRRAAQARKAHMYRLALASSKARAAKKAAR